MITVAVLYGAVLALIACAAANVGTWLLVQFSEFWRAPIGPTAWRRAYVPVGGVVVGIIAWLVGSTMLGAVALGLGWGAIEMRWVDDDVEEGWR